MTTSRRRATRAARPVDNGAPPELQGSFLEHDAWATEASMRQWFTDNGIPAPDYVSGGTAHGRRDAAVFAWAIANGIKTAEGKPDAGRLRALGIPLATPSRERARFNGWMTNRQP